LARMGATFQWFCAGQAPAAVTGLCVVLYFVRGQVAAGYLKARAARRQ
jgi:hypothetical protein